MRACATFAGVIVLALFAAVFALRPPSPAPANAPPSAFSAARAMPDVNAIARAPHPIRSAEQSRVRDYLFGRMVALGLTPQLRPVDSEKGTLFNILGVLPGADPKARALLLMAHYDSVPPGPGAADDGAGVAAVLETVRALAASGPQARDVMVLLTDGEEPGLYGAKSFFTNDPASAHAWIAINLEARGNRGKAVMFETNRQGGALVGLLTRSGALTGASSLMPDLYRRLPNDTDPSPALQRGVAGINFAFFGGLDAYHGPSDTPERLDKGSLQSIGDQALAAARVLATTPALPGRALDQVYADILGGPILTYPADAGWLIIAAAIVCIAIAAWNGLKRDETGIAGVSGGFGAFAGLIAVLILVLPGDGLIRSQIAGRHLAPFLRRGAEVLTGAALLAAGLALVWFWLASKALRPASLRLGALKVLALLAVFLQLTAPLDAFMVAWPLLLAAIAVAFADRPLIATPFALAGLAQVFYWAGLLFALIGQTTPAILVPISAVSVALLLAVAPTPGRMAALVGGAVAMVGLALTLAAMRA